MQTASVRESSISGGDFGSLTTLERMRSLSNMAIKMPIVVETAHSIVAGIPPRDYYGMAVAIRNWLASVFHFIPDPVGVELLRAPDYQLRQYQTQMRITGDCDDAAVLGAALGKAVGIPAQFVAIGFKPSGPLSHVYAQLTPLAKVPTVVSLDVTKPYGIHVRVFRTVKRTV